MKILKYFLLTFIVFSFLFWSLGNCYICSGYENEGESNIIGVMNQYIGNSWTTEYDLPLGLRNYIRDVGVNNTVVGVSGYSFSRIKTCINNRKPVCLAYTLTNNIAHWVVAHGYMNSVTDGNYIIVNDGLGSNNVWLSADENIFHVVHLQK